MVVPLARIFAQQPPIATVRPLLSANTNETGQQNVAQAVCRMEDGTYKCTLLKLFISLVEQEGQPVDSDIWEVYYELQTPSKVAEIQAKSGEPSLVKYDLPNEKYVTIPEDRNTLICAGETGHRTWESSLALTEYICENVEQFRDLGEVIELGAGTGLVSLALGKLGLSHHITATDCSGIVIQKLSETISRNGLDNAVSARLFDWTDRKSIDELPKRATVFAGDILYGLTTIYPQILDTLAELRPKRVLFCNPVRNREHYEQFSILCRDRGVRVKLLKQFKAESAEESDFMFIVSVPPIPLELIELSLE